MVTFEIEFQDTDTNGRINSFDAVMAELQTSTPVIVRGSKVKRKTKNDSNAMGAEMLPILEILVGAPALLLLIREISNIIQTNIKKKAKIIFKTRDVKGKIREIEVESDQMSTIETQNLLIDLFKNAD